MYIQMLSTVICINVFHIVQGDNMLSSVWCEHHELEETIVAIGENILIQRYRIHKSKYHNTCIKEYMPKNTNIHYIYIYIYIYI